MRHIKIILAVTLMLLAGCVDTRIADQAREHLGRTGVVSLLGNSFHAIHIGTTLFNNDAYDADVSSWNVDQDAAEHVRAELATDGIETDTLSLEPVARERFRRDDKGEFNRRDSSVEANYEELCRLASRQGYDTLIVIVGSGANEYGPPLKPGYGVFVRSFLGMSRGFTYAQFMIRVIDVKNEKQLAREISQPTDAVMSKAIPWKTNLDEYSPERRAAFKSGVEDHMRHEIDRMLTQMNLDATKSRPERSTG